MADDKARIQASLEGADQVASEARKIEGALTGAGKKIEGALGGALGSVGQTLGGVIQSGLMAAGVFQSISLGKAVDEARRFDETTTRFGQAAGIGADVLRSKFEGLESKLLTSAPAIGDFSKALGRATYDAKGSAEALEGLGSWALATGQTLEEQLDVGHTLRSSLGVIGDTTDELGRLRTMAESVGTVGGPVAFLDTLKSLSPMLQGVAADADGTKHKTEALLAVLGKGLPAAQAARVGASVDSTLRSRALDIERVTGRHVLDDNNQLINPTETLRDLKRLSQRRHGGRKEEMRRALINTYGADLGLAIYRTDLDQVDQVSQSRDSGKTAKEAEALRNSPAGRRIANRLAQDTAMRDAGGQALQVHDWLMQNLGPGGTLALGFLGGNGMLNKVAGAGSKVLGTAGQALGLGGTTGAIALGAGASMAGAAGAVLYEIGQERGEMGKDYRAGKGAKTIGAEMARRAEEGGDIAPVYGLAQDPETGQTNQAAVKEMLTLLEGRFDQLNDTLRTQVAAGIAAELRRAPIVVRSNTDPSAKGREGNPG